jgi:shikimate kinase
MKMKKGNKSNLVLTGFMATGKSTVGQLAAKKLDYAFIDTDDLIEKRWGKRIADIFSEEGEHAFRKKEARIAAELGERRGFVIATGGGMMQNSANVDAFKRQGHIYCLSASLDTILERISKDNRVIRPLVQVDDSRKRIQALMAERKSMYDQFIQIDTTGKTPEQVAAELLVIHGKIFRRYI